MYKIPNKYKKLFNILPILYKNIFKGKLELSHQESLEIKWLDVFNHDSKENSYLLNQLIWKIRKMDKFKKYNKNKKFSKYNNNECLFLE